MVEESEEMAVDVEEANSIVSVAIFIFWKIIRLAYETYRIQD